MNRRLLWLPVVAMVLLAAVWGYRLGQVPSESEIIAFHAARYVAARGEGAAITDCVARPGEAAQVRMVITCTHPAGDETVVAVGLRGGIVAP